LAYRHVDVVDVALLGQDVVDAVQPACALFLVVLVAYLGKPNYRLNYETAVRGHNEFWFPNQHDLDGVVRWGENKRDGSATLKTSKFFRVLGLKIEFKRGLEP
jgi:hypothetical protein